MSCCSKYAGRLRGQRFRLAELQEELDSLVAAGDEYHAEGVRQDMQVAASLSRLVHRCDPFTETPNPKTNPNGETHMTTPDFSNMTPEQLQAALIAATTQNEELKAKAAKQATMSFKVSEKGAISVYGLGRFPVTLYKAQMLRLLEAAPAIHAFITANEKKLAVKPA
jgi:hypothetical protein